MKEVRTEIVIDAPISQVWKVLMDHEAYADWNPFIKEIKGDVQVGGELSVLIKPNGAQGAPLSPIVLVNQPEREFRWQGSLGSRKLLQGEHYFQLRPITETQTHFIHGEKFTGLLSYLMMGTIIDKIEEGFHAMNGALKDQIARLQAS